MEYFGLTAVEQPAPFWERLGIFGHAPALVDEHSGRIWTYRDLMTDVASCCDQLRKYRKKLIFLFASTDAGAVICYLGALAAKVSIFLGNGKITWPEIDGLIDAYSPDVLLWKGTAENLPVGYRVTGDLFGYSIAERSDEPLPITDGVALLLSTSGSFGSPKMVRLSAANIAAASLQVSEALALDPSQRAITTLPINFVYGLSVINSHLAVGASLVLTQRSIQDKAFWQLLDDTCATSLSGVPWTFATLRKLSFDPTRHPSMRRFSLSGGSVSSDLLAWLMNFREAGIGTYSMYGQTEACGRMAVLPPDMLVQKTGSVGLPVRAGRISCDCDGNIIFRGPNVMLGYARNRHELNGTDDQKGILVTGDVGHLDKDGFLYITGRASRIVKLLGLRIDLDEVETFLGRTACAAAICDGGTLQLFFENIRALELDRQITELIRRLRVPNHAIKVFYLSSLPRNEHGKIVYGSLPVVARQTIQ